MQGCCRRFASHAGRVQPSKGRSSRIRPCLSVNYRADVNKDCPKELQVKSNDEVIACKSACLAFNQPRDCCSGEFNDPNKCKPTEFSKFFKDRCPNTATLCKRPSRLVRVVEEEASASMVGDPN
ncbi:unnamed protein product [Citrullus colocynthis]|uniref:Uncharacterized protein n=1 Tax=Citrullus colocynthis TaxID=252529 RepID=A0ABP0ZBA0_9ROSI